MNIYERAHALHPHCIALRRQLHQYPELAWQEYQTQTLICNELDAIGISYETPFRTAVIATLAGT